VVEIPHGAEVGAVAAAGYRVNRSIQLPQASVRRHSLEGGLVRRPDPVRVEPGPWIQNQLPVCGLVGERNANDEVLERHVHRPSVDDLVLSELNGAVYYYHQDHLNSTIAVTDAGGSLVEQYRYDVYGHPSFYSPDGAPRAESALAIRFLFTGREWLSSLALYDYRHRLYSPSLGRFLQLDPLGFGAGEVNFLNYGHNGAVAVLDPFGLRKVTLHFYTTLSANVLTERAKVVAEEIYYRAFAKCGNKKNCLEFKWTFVEQEPLELGRHGDEWRFVITRNDMLHDPWRGFLTGRQKGWVTEINVDYLRVQAAEKGSDAEVALGVVIAHETGYHGVLGRPSLSRLPHGGHYAREGFVDSPEPPAAIFADFSPQTSRRIIRTLGLD